MKHNYQLVVYLKTGLIIFLSLFSCDKANQSPEVTGIEEDYIPEYEFCEEMISRNLLDVFGNDLGNVYISNDQEHVHITLKTRSSWYLEKSYLYIGRIENVPKDTNGEPNPLNFPYYRQHTPHVDLYTFEIALEDLEISDNIIIVYSEMLQKDDSGNEIQSSTARIAGINYPNSSTNMQYVDFTPSECEGCSYGIDTTEFLAGQNIPAGYLTYTNDADYLYVSYHTTDGWYLNASKLYVGDLSNLPVNGGGNPVPGQFPYQQGYVISTNQYTYQIPLDGLSDCFIIAAYADVYKDDNGVILSEGAWGYGTEIPGSSSWGWYSDYCIKNCE